jgi:hypothetical protein
MFCGFRSNQTVDIWDAPPRSFDAIADSKPVGLNKCRHGKFVCDEHYDRCGRPWFSYAVGYYDDPSGPK